MANKDRTIAYRKTVDRGFPGPVIRYFYVTELNGRKWVADIEDEHAEYNWDNFTVDPDPTGFDAELARGGLEEYMRDADPIGYIEDGKLVINKRWKRPSAYGYKPDMTPVVTSWETCGL